MTFTIRTIQQLLAQDAVRYQEEQLGNCLQDPRLVATANGRTVRLCPVFATLSAEEAADTLVHELAHLAGADHQPELYLPDDAEAMADLSDTSPDQAVRSAEHYAYAVFYAAGRRPREWNDTIRSFIVNPFGN